MDVLVCFKWMIRKQVVLDFPSSLQQITSIRWENKHQSKGELGEAWIALMLTIGHHPQCNSYIKEARNPSSFQIYSTKLHQQQHRNSRARIVVCFQYKEACYARVSYKGCHRRCHRQLWGHRLRVTLWPQRLSYQNLQIVSVADSLFIRSRSQRLAKK